MSVERTGARLLRAYPPAWRRRYGRELESLIVEASEGGRVGWRTRLDVVLAGGRERVRAAAAGPEGSPGERIEAALIRVLCAWSLFVVGGLILQRFSEHWQDATPADVQHLPSFAFAVLIVAAACGAALILVGTAVTAPAFLVHLRETGSARVRRQLLGPVALTALTAVATILLVIWASGLDADRREGGNTAYAIGSVVWALLICGCLASWTAAAARIARSLSPDALVLRVRCWLCAGLVVAMATTTAALLVWWISLASASHSFLVGSASGGAGSGLPAQLAAAALLMLTATVLAGTGASRALREASELPRGRPALGRRRR